MCGYPNKNTPKLVSKKNNNELPSIVPLLIFFELIPIYDINIKDKYTNIVIELNPKNKSDMNIHNNGNPNEPIVYIVIYWMNSNGESFASVSTPETSEVCIVFRTFNLQINPNLIKSFGTKT